MTLQSTVNINSGFGIAGELIVDGPMRAESVIVNSAGANPNNIGAAFMRNASTGVASVGGVPSQGAFAGTASIAPGPGTNGTMTVTAISSGMPSIGQTVAGANVTGTPKIIGYISVNNDGTGTYLLDTSETAASAAVTGASGPITVFGGILVMPKQQALVGTAAGGTLAPTLAIADNMQADLLYMGIIVLSSSTACNIGDQLVYNIITGAISTVAPGATPGANTRAVPNGVVYRYPTAAAGLIAGKLTN